MNMFKPQCPGYAPQATLTQANLRRLRISTPQVVGLKTPSPADASAATLPPATDGSTRLEIGAREYCNPALILPDTPAMAELDTARILTQTASTKNEREMRVPKMAPGVSVESESQSNAVHRRSGSASRGSVKKDKRSEQSAPAARFILF